MAVSLDNAEYRNIGDVLSLEYGKPLKEKERKGGDYPVMGSNGRIGFHDTYIVEGPTIIVGRKGSAGALVWEEKDCYPIDTAFYIQLKYNNIELKYIYYLLQTISFSKEKQSAGVPGLNRNDVYKIKIPLPPLPIQKAIVSILDKFDTLVNDMKIGLPAEIAARKKQYEYYRNKLLSFSEA